MDTRTRQQRVTPPATRRPFRPRIIGTPAPVRATDSNDLLCLLHVL